MSHLNLRFPPELLALDNAMEAYMEEFRRKNLHVVPKCRQCYRQGCGGECMANSITWGGTEEIPQKPRILPADEPLQMLSEEESKLCKWARAWLKVAKGIIG